MTGDDVYFIFSLFFPKLHRLERSHMPPFWALVSENSIVYSTLLNSWSNVINGVSTLYFLFGNELCSNIRLLIAVQPPLEKSVKSVLGNATSQAL